MIRVPGFVDWRTAARYPVIVPPAPIDADTLSGSDRITLGLNGSCLIDTLPPA